MESTHSSMRGIMSFTDIRPKSVQTLWATMPTLVGKKVRIVYQDPGASWPAGVIRYRQGSYWLEDLKTKASTQLDLGLIADILLYAKEASALQLPSAPIVWYTPYSAEAHWTSDKITCENGGWNFDWIRQSTQYPNDDGVAYAWNTRFLVTWEDRERPPTFIAGAWMGKGCPCNQTCKCTHKDHYVVYVEIPGNMGERKLPTPEGIHSITRL